MTQRLTTTHNSQPVRRLWALGGLLLIGAAAAAFSVNALADGHRGGHHGEVCMHEGASRHHAGTHMGQVRHLDRLLGEAKLTDAQRTQIRDIQTQAQTDLKALHTQDRTPVPHGLSLLSQAKPDAAAAEQARQQMLARHDKVSQRLLQAQLDIANVLTPTQRAKIASEMKARQERLAERAERRAAHRAERAASQPADRPSAPH